MLVYSVIIRKGQILLCNHKVFDARIRTYCRNARMDVLKSFHDIRRTVLTNLYYAKMPLKDIQRFAGHSSIQQTMDYIKIKEDDLSALSFIETLMPIDEGISTEIISFEKKKAKAAATGNPCFSR